MRRSFPVGVFAAMALFGWSVAAGPALAQKGGGAPVQVQGQARTVTVINAAGQQITVIYVSPVTIDDWGNDVLGNQVLRPGQQVQVLIRDGGGCRYDIRVVYQSRFTEDRRNLDLCRIENVTFNGANAQAPQTPGQNAQQGQQRPPAAQGQRPPAQAGNPDFTLVNNSGMRIDTLNVSPVTSDSWGADLLGDGTLAPGARFAVRLNRPGECRFDVRVVYQDRREEERRNIDLCAIDDLAMTGAQARPPQAGGGGQQAQPGAGGQQARPPAQPGPQQAVGGPQTGTPSLVLNNTGRAVINEIYVRRQGATEWGIDRLGDRTMSNGMTFTLDLPAAEGCIWSLRVVFQSARPEERANVNLCAGQPVAFSAQVPPGQLLSTGSGFYVTREGHVMTNRHVIEGCGTVAIARPNGQRLPLRVLGEDAVNDLAMLQLAGTVSPVLSMRANASPIRAGERVVVLGYPVRQVLGELNVTEGNLSALRGPRGDTSLFQYTAPTQGGNSGGPILDESGLVIGVVVSRVENLPGGRPAQNINFGIQVDVARRFAQSLGVSIDEQPAREARRTPDIAERAQPAVLPLDCLS